LVDRLLARLLVVVRDQLQDDDQKTDDRQDGDEGDGPHLLARQPTRVVHLRRLVAEVAVVGRPTPTGPPLIAPSAVGTCNRVPGLSA
jgi:hypothetical protein